MTPWNNLSPTQQPLFLGWSVKMGVEEWGTTGEDGVVAEKKNIKHEKVATHTVAEDYVWYACCQSIW